MTTKGSNNLIEDRKDRAAEIANTFEWLITAFILAFVFRAFVMEAFRIPTGSMADTLKGAHFRLRCSQCGYRYDYGFVPGNFGYREDHIPPPGATLKTYRSECPSCGFKQPVGGGMHVSNGDRILVLKCIYQFMEPDRWDVVVFKNPLDPRINYIKRLIGLPGEEIEIIDGDIYVDGVIQRKPPKVQKELWMPIYNNDYQPVRPEQGSFNWTNPFDPSDSDWRVNEPSPTLLSLDSDPNSINLLSYQPRSADDFLANYAYNSPGAYFKRPVASDLMIRFEVRTPELQGRVGAALSKYGIIYEGYVDMSGHMVISKIEDGNEQILVRRRKAAPEPDKLTSFSFANVDHKLVLRFGSATLEHDLGLSADAAGPRRPEENPVVEIMGAGKLTLAHVAVFRDIHYTGGPVSGRAVEGNPFRLNEDEFFVLGDNSPNSEDGRWWSQPGIANQGKSYRPGVVPRDYMVGKAIFVYWPAGFKPFRRFRFAFIPNVGQMRFIYGGKDE